MKMKLYVLLQLLVSYVTALPGKTGNVVQVELPQGTFEGHREIEADWNPGLERPPKYYYSFLGIPYAKPPVGELRFKDPIPPEPWTGVRKSIHPPACPQMKIDENFQEGKTFIGEEDCLQLNVHTPIRPIDFENSIPQPVMVYIHGGGYTVGHLGFMGGHPARLMKTGGIVFVALQYRLGALGFLSTEDSVLPGNYGLKDQTLALKWVKENIHLFGGDPQRITIFGESAGGGSSHLHLFIPSSHDYFHQAIFQSGLAIAHWAERVGHAKPAMEIGQRLNCSNYSDSANLLECLQNASVESLIRINSDLRGGHIFPILMSPRVDGEYLPGHPPQLLKEGKYKKVNMISGVTQNEAALFLRGLWNSSETANEAFMKQYVEKTLPVTFGTDEENNTKYLTERIFFHYVPEWSSFDASILNMEEMLSDMVFCINADLSAMMHGRDAAYGAKFYRYELEHRGERSFGDMGSYKYGQKWVSHLDDLMYLFDGVMDSPAISRKDDLMMSEVILKLWTNFARTGNPTPNLDLGFKWDPMESPTDLRYLSLVPAPSMKENKRSKHLKFWMDLPLMRNKMMFPERFV